MSSLKFIETIKIKNKDILNLPLHEDRMKRTVKHFYNESISLKITSNMIPQELKKGTVKCRVVYSTEIHSIEFEPYELRTISSLKLVDGGGIAYSFKYHDRTELQSLLQQKETADDILIVKDGLITDTSYSNVLFEDDYGRLFTPVNCLLEGVKRTQLLSYGIVKKRIITVDDLKNYRKLYIVNSMVGVDDVVTVDIKNIY